MKVDTLEKLYHDQMAGLQRGGEDLLALLPDLVGVVMHFDLRNSIRDFIPRLREQIGRIEHVIPYNAVTRQVRVSPGIQGLIDECHSFLERASDPDVIDAGLVVFLQKVLHVWMVGHAALGAYAMMLGKEDEAKEFRRSLEEQTEAERELARLARDVINVEALSASTRSSAPVGPDAEAKAG